MYTRPVIVQAIRVGVEVRDRKGCTWFLGEGPNEEFRLAFDGNVTRLTDGSLLMMGLSVVYSRHGHGQFHLQRVW